MLHIGVGCQCVSPWLWFYAGVQFCSGHVDWKMDVEGGESSDSTFRFPILLAVHIQAKGTPEERAAVHCFESELSALGTLGLRNRV